MSLSPRLPVIVISAAYLCGIVALLFWLGQALGSPALGPLNPRTFLRYGWLVPAGLVVAFLSSCSVPREPWIGSQFVWLIRSFVGLLVAAVAGFLCLSLGSWFQVEAFAVAAFAVWGLGGLWFLYRWGWGLSCLIRKRPVGRGRG